MFIPILIIISLLSLSLFFVPLNRKWAIAAGITGVGAIASLTMMLVSLFGDTPWVESLGRSLSFGEEFFACDPLSALFVFIICLAMIPVMVYARGYLENYLDKKSPTQISIHYISLITLFISMICVSCATGGLAFLLSWEVMTLSSFMLILFDAEREEVRSAAVNYLILMHVGFFFLISGFTVLQVSGVPPTFAALGEYFAGHKITPLFLLFFVGFGMKAGMFPLHVWLPEAHPAAPAHVSALMSGVMIKMGIYGIARVCSMVPDEGLYTIGLIVLFTGIATAFWGVILATAQRDIKRVLAYSSIENIGIILIGLGIGLVGLGKGNTLLALCGLGGGLLHTLNHSLFKPLLFMGAGSIYSSAHTTSLGELGGLSRRMPRTALIFLGGVAGICALPPLNGFISEFLIYFGLLDSITDNTGISLLSVFSLISLALVSGLVVLAFTRLYGVAFGGVARSEKATEAKEVGAWMLAGMAIPLACMIVIGIAPQITLGSIMSIVGGTFGLENTGVYKALFSSDAFVYSFVILTLIIICAGLYFHSRRKLRERPSHSSPTWGCGFTAPDSSMQYTGESFSEGLHRIVGPLTRKQTGNAIPSPEEIFPAERDYDVRHKDKIDILFSAWWVELITKLNSRMRFFDTSKINHHILFALVFLVLILVLSFFNVI